MQDKEALQQISRDLSRLQNALSGPGGVTRQLEGQLRQLENRLLRQFEQTMLAQLQTMLPAGIAQAVPILGRLLPGMADGGVLDGSQPAVLAGEAGPEAVLPLKRGPDGRLGVAAIGGPAQMPTHLVAEPVTERSGRPAAEQAGNGLGNSDSLGPTALQAPRISIHLHMEQPAAFSQTSGFSQTPLAAIAEAAPPLPAAGPAPLIWQADSDLFAGREGITAPAAQTELDLAPLGGSPPVERILQEAVLEEAILAGASRDQAPASLPAGRQAAVDLPPPQLDASEILTRLELDQLSGMLRRALEQAVDHRLEENMVQLRGQWGGYL